MNFMTMALFYVLDGFKEGKTGLEHSGIHWWCNERTERVDTLPAYNFGFRCNERTEYHKEVNG